MTDVRNNSAKATVSKKGEIKTDVWVKKVETEVINRGK